jgi:hypothetical protein
VCLSPHDRAQWPEHMHHRETLRAYVGCYGVRARTRTRAIGQGARMCNIVQAAPY